MKLKFFLKDNKKIYTLKETKETKDAHYKFVKIRDAPKSDIKFFKK
jgi:hypothetical protein